MFTLLTGPGYDADGDLSWGAHWNLDREDDWTGHAHAEESDHHPVRVVAWYWSSHTEEQRTYRPRGREPW